MEVNPAAPARDPFERSEAQRRFQRSPRFIFSVAVVLAVFCGVMSIPSVVRVLGIATHDAYALAISCLCAMIFASVAMHTFGGRDRRYIIASTIENLVYAVALMTVIYRSKPDCFIWLFYVLVASLNGSTNEKRAALRFGIILPPTTLSLAYLVLRGDAVAAGASLIAGSIAVFAFEAQAVTAARLDQATRNFDEAQEALKKVQFVRERERIARDLHDGIAADLSAIAMRAQRLAVDDSSDAKSLRSIAARASDGLDDLRTTVWALSKPECGFDEVVEYVRARASDLATPETTVEVSAEPSARTLSGDEAGHVQRIVDECVRNAIRHAKASRIIVKLVDDPLRIEIADDGVGLPQAPGGRRSGLKHLEARAQALGAALSIDGASGQGTKIVVSRQRA